MLMTIENASGNPRAGRPAAAIPMAPQPPGWYAAARAAIDAAVALVLLVLTFPLVLVLLGLVKLTSRGPALYTQVRQGRGGRPYTIYKLRSMTHECERDSGPRWSIGNDPRVTRLGRLLRRTHLDELPQLWNVVRGEMSLVGPRPERPELAAELELAYPHFQDRLAVRPGITGLAQIQLPADSDLPGVGRKLACDLCYIREMGPWLDLKILVGTAMKVAGVPLGSIRERLALPPWTVREPAVADSLVVELKPVPVTTSTVREAAVSMVQAG
jgi:lipopolysaccharide/colanic/teichoic acid biosynthesis glycosyltransferase